VQQPAKRLGACWVRIAEGRSRHHHPGGVRGRKETQITMSNDTAADLSDRGARALSLLQHDALPAVEGEENWYWLYAPVGVGEARELERLKLAALRAFPFTTMRSPEEATTRLAIQLTSYGAKLRLKPRQEEEQEVE